MGSVRWADAHFLSSGVYEDDQPPQVTTASGIYSFGSVMLEVRSCQTRVNHCLTNLSIRTQILSGRMPYHYLRTGAQVVMELHQAVKPRRPAPSFVDDGRWSLIQCWTDPPSGRPDIWDVRETVGLLCFFTISLLEAISLSPL
jgi:hypothetical protein